MYDPEHCYEEDWGYTGDSLNDGSAEPQADWKNCKSFCSSSYPTSEYFTHKSSDNTCWCKMSRDGEARRPNGRHKSVGTVSGELSEACKGSVITGLDSHFVHIMKELILKDLSLVIPATSNTNTM